MNNFEEEKTTIEPTEKTSKKVSIPIMILCLLIGFGIGFGVTYFTSNNDETTEEKEEGKKEEVAEEVKEEEKDNNTENNEKEENDNVISAELQKDLEKKTEITKFLAIDIIYDKELYNSGRKNVIAENNDSIYSYLAYATYEYYTYKSGVTLNKWSTKDSSYGPCYDQGQNGYCYPINKADILVYEKQLYNMGEKIFDLGDYAIIKGDKVYVTSVPWNGWVSVKTVKTVSVAKNADKSISYIVNYKVEGIGNETKNVNVVYLFKLNSDGNYYLYSVAESK